MRTSVFSNSKDRKPATTDPDPVAELAAELAADGAAPLLTLREAAHFGRLHYQTAWELAQCHKFPAFKRRGRWLVQRVELARWILKGGA